jgi:hypothetical protein
VWSDNIPIEETQVCIIEDVPYNAGRATLQVRGYLIPAIVTASIRCVTEFAQREDLRYQGARDEVPDMKDAETMEMLGKFYPDTWDVVGTNFVTKERLWCLPIRGRVSTADPSFRDLFQSHVSFLGLRSVGTGDQRMFTRVGEGHGFISYTRFVDAKMERILII